MPLFKNVSPQGDLELVLHQQDDEDGTVLTPQRVVTVLAGETVEVSDVESIALDGATANWAPVEIKA